MSNSRESGVVPDIAAAPRNNMSPFLKWAGGKRWLAEEVDASIPASYKHYFEPFLGGGAVFFHVGPTAATLSDVNGELINTFVQVRDHVELLIEALSTLRVNKKTYLSMRRRMPASDIDRAARFIYLNKTAFNGIYRVNQSGKFNVPFAGIQHRPIHDEIQLRLTSSSLAACQIHERDFEVSMREAKDGDVIYCDPPYTVQHNNNGFIRYNESLFSWKDQQRLALAAQEAVERGVHVLVSNACHGSIRRLYKGFRARRVSRTSCMAGNVMHRGETEEYLLLGSRRGD